MADELVTITVQVNYIDGTNYEYKVKGWDKTKTIEKAKSYAYSIVTSCFHQRKDGSMVYYPVHQIKNVVLLGVGDVDRRVIFEQKQPDAPAEEKQ